MRTSVSSVAGGAVVGVYLNEVGGRHRARPKRLVQQAVELHLLAFGEPQRGHLAPVELGVLREAGRGTEHDRGRRDGQGTDEGRACANLLCHRRSPIPVVCVGAEEGRLKYTAGQAGVAKVADARDSKSRIP